VDSVVRLVCLRISFPMRCARMFTQSLAKGYLTQPSKRRPFHDGGTMYGQSEFITVLLYIISMRSDVATGIRGHVVVLQPDRLCKALSGGTGSQAQRVP